MTSILGKKPLTLRGRTVLAIVGIAAMGGLVAGVPACRTTKKSADADSADVRALIATLTDQQRMTSAGRVRARCEGALADPCGCVKVAIHEALDASLVDPARAILTHGKSACTESLAGQEAEMDARAGVAGADAKARVVLAARPADPYAAYALGQLAWASDDRAGAQRWADAAVVAGREAPAHLLVGLLALGRGEVEVARGAFTRVLETEPADVAALYDIALCDQRLGRYRAAREGYLSVLRKNPRHLDARYNLVVLTQGGGFRDEAAHHLAELRKIAPGDPRIARLEALMAAPVPSASAPPAPSAAPSAR